MMSGSSAPLETITKSDHAAQVLIVDYMLVVFSAIVVVARGIVRYRIARIISLNDLVTLSALVSHRLQPRMNGRI